MGIHQTTTLSCPLCGNSWSFVHTYHTKPIVGRCGKCAFTKASGVCARGMIEHRGPKTLPDAGYYGSSSHE